jgi:chemotaxis protein CheD
MELEVMEAECERLVGLGELVVTDDPTVTLVAPGVGSCVIVCAYHRRAKVAGMAHIVLPSSENFRGTASKPFWFADRAIPHLLASLQAKGAVRPNCVVVGGANMFQLAIPSPQQDVLNIGAMNVQAVLELLRPATNIVAQFVGGDHGWFVRFRVADGVVTVRSGDGKAHQIAL